MKRSWKQKQEHWQKDVLPDMTFKGVDLYNINLFIADSKQSGCDYAQAPIFRKINQKMYSDETQTLHLI